MSDLVQRLRLLSENAPVQFCDSANLMSQAADRIDELERCREAYIDRIERIENQLALFAAKDDRTDIHNIVLQRRVDGLETVVRNIKALFECGLLCGSDPKCMRVIRDSLINLDEDTVD